MAATIARSIRHAAQIQEVLSMVWSHGNAAHVDTTGQVYTVVLQAMTRYVVDSQERQSLRDFAGSWGLLYVWQIDSPGLLYQH